MKSTTLTIAIAMILLAVTSLNANIINANNNEVKLSEEDYVNDVPFDTKAIVANLDEDKVSKSEQSNQNVEMPEEDYVNDVNIDTRQVVKEQFSSIIKTTGRFFQSVKKGLKNFSEKGYIKNNELNLVKLYTDIVLEDQESDVRLEEESYVDDVPFDTEKVTEQLKHK
ncbi:MAG: hypothetical protein K9H84_04860 [Bacteroidales bacterium]|nr:hypothetical protein [Bacteroidales bacterium]